MRVAKVMVGGLKGYSGGNCTIRPNLPPEKIDSGGAVRVMCQSEMLDSEGRVMVMEGGGEVRQSFSS